MLEITKEVVKVVNSLKNGQLPGGGCCRDAQSWRRSCGWVAVWHLARSVLCKEGPSEWKRSVLVLIHKANDWKLCNNNGGIALLSIPKKVLFLILLESRQTIISTKLLDSQCGFRRGWGMVNEIWVTWQLVDWANEFQTHYIFRVCEPDLSLRFCGLFHAGHHPETLWGRTATSWYCYWLVYLHAEIGIVKVCQKSLQSRLEYGRDAFCPYSSSIATKIIYWEAAKMTERGLQIEYCTRGGLFLTYRDKTPLTASIRNIQYADDLAMALQTDAELQGI